MGMVESSLSNSHFVGPERETILHQICIVNIYSYIYRIYQIISERSRWLSARCRSSWAIPKFLKQPGGNQWHEQRLWSLKSFGFWEIVWSFLISGVEQPELFFSDKKNMRLLKNPPFLSYEKIVRVLFQLLGFSIAWQPFSGWVCHRTTDGWNPASEVGSFIPLHSCKLT